MEWIQFPDFNHLRMYGQLESLLSHFATFDVNLFLPPTVLYVDVARKMKCALVTPWVFVALNWNDGGAAFPQAHCNLAG